MSDQLSSTKDDRLLSDPNPDEEEIDQLGLMDEVSSKVEEAKKTDLANKGLSAENEIPITDGSTKGEKALSAIGYIMFFCVLPLIIKRESKFCQFHGKQGLILTLLYLFFHLFIFWSSVLSAIIGFTYLVGIIVGIVYSVQGKIIRFPLIEKAVDKLDFD